MEPWQAIEQHIPSDVQERLEARRILAGSGRIMSDLGGINQDDMLLPRCTKCGLYLVPEELATGPMNEVELLLEDK